MWTRLSLRNRIYLILTALVCITLMGGMVLVRYTYQIEAVINTIVDEDIVAFQSAEVLQDALVNQKGFVSYYFMDGDPKWLRKLGEYRQIFRERLHEAEVLALNDRQKDALERIRREYESYIKGKDRVIALYMDGKREAGMKLHQEVRDYYFKILDLCQKYKDLHTARILKAHAQSHSRARDLRYFAGTAVGLAFFLGLMMAFVLIKQILDPLRELAREGEANSRREKGVNEVKALSRKVYGLIEDAGQTHIELERSREHLLQAEKMAMVGKLAAGMAHSIRNPLTSVKMRLFSLSRSLDLNEDQKEDFQVISEEIRHTDTIVQNFLEFSRPPKLQVQAVSPSVVVDLAIQLLKHRLKSYDVKVQVLRDELLPEILGDPEQLKEVLVNIMVNACEAMGSGGSIVIREEVDTTLPGAPAAVIRVSDSGPGISGVTKEKLFQPFYTTKEDGTGLGLSIAGRIIEEHRGRLEVYSKEGEGATFTITLPMEESDFGKNTDN